MYSQSSCIKYLCGHHRKSKGSKMKRPSLSCVYEQLLYCIAGLKCHVIGQVNFAYVQVKLAGLHGIAVEAWNYAFMKSEVAGSPLPCCSWAMQSRVLQAHCCMKRDGEGTSSLKYPGLEKTLWEEPGENYVGTAHRSPCHSSCLYEEEESMTLWLLVTNENPCCGKLTRVCLIKEPGRCDVT